MFFHFFSMNNTGIFFFAGNFLFAGKIARPLFCMMNYNLERNAYNYSENREKLGDYLKLTDYSNH